MLQFVSAPLLSPQYRVPQNSGVYRKGAVPRMVSNALVMYGGSSCPGEAALTPKSSQMVVCYWAGCIKAQLCHPRRTYPRPNIRPDVPESMNMKDIKGFKEAAGQRVNAKKGSEETLLSQDEFTETTSLLGDTRAKGQPRTTISKGDENDSPEDEVTIEVNQGAVNLIGVDAQRISDFCGYSSEIPGTLSKVAISVAFLVRLIGWWAIFP